MRDHEVDGGAGADRPARRAAAEQAADHVLGRAVAAGRPEALRPGDVLRLQALAGNEGVQSLVDPAEAVHDAVGRSGAPLEPAVRRDMESALGHDFGDVQVHTGAAAATSARAVQAQAYTVGSHVVFGEGRYQPGTTEGRRTLAHELTHVVQQRQGPVDGTPLARSTGGLQVSDPGDPYEREAEAVADAVVQRTAAPTDDRDDPTEDHDDHDDHADAG